MSLTCFLKALPICCAAGLSSCDRGVKAVSSPIRFSLGMLEAICLYFQSQSAAYGDFSCIWAQTQKSQVVSPR